MHYTLKQKIFYVFIQLTYSRGGGTVQDGWPVSHAVGMARKRTLTAQWS